MLWRRKGKRRIHPGDLEVEGQASMWPKHNEEGATCFQLTESDKNSDLLQDNY